MFWFLLVGFVSLVGLIGTYTGVVEFMPIFRLLFGFLLVCVAIVVALLVMAKGIHHYWEAWTGRNVSSAGPEIMTGSDRFAAVVLGTMFIIVALACLFFVYEEVYGI